MSALPAHWIGPPCERCDRPTATQAAWDECGEGKGEELCWVADTGRCRTDPHDWRSEALRLREAVDALLAYHVIWEDDDYLLAPMQQKIAALRAARKGTP